MSNRQTTKRLCASVLRLLRRGMLGSILALAAIHVVWAKSPTFSAAVEQWGLQEIVLHSDRRHRNPFKDVTLQASFRCGDKTVLTNGFYDGNETWKIRLMPQVQGHWTFQTRSNDRLLDGKSGAFTVGPPATGNHGPVKVAKTYHFSHADGTPYFPLGTTLYNWLNRDPALEQRTLAALAKSPFNKVRFGLFPKWMPAYNSVDPPVYPYLKTNQNRFDWDRFDPRFFAHVEERLRDLQQLGIEADVILFHPYDHWGFAKMDAAHDEAYIRYVAARLSAFRNVWWTLANEYNVFDSKMPGFGPGVVKNWDRMFQVLQSADPHGHLTGMHNAGPWYDHAKPWITHVVAQEQKRLGPLTLRGRQTYGKPVLMDEFGYEGNGAAWWGNLTAPQALELHWQVTMAGGYASHGETYVHSGGLLWWSVGGDLVGESPARLSFLKKVMSAAPFQDLMPAPELVMGGDALAKPGEYYLFRFPKHLVQPAQIKVEGSGPFQVELIDPWQMKIYPLGHITPGEQAFSLFMTPSLLRFTKAKPGTSALTSGTLTELLSRFLGDTTQPAAPKLREFKAETQYYSLEYPLNELVGNPSARAVIEKYKPSWITIPDKFPLSAGLPLEIFRHSPEEGEFGISTTKLNALAGELAQIPVQ